MGESAPMFSPVASLLGTKAPAPTPAPAADPSTLTPAPEANATPTLPPADPDGRTGPLVRVGWYALAAVVSSCLVAAGLRLDVADFHAPFSYDDDSLLILPMVKATLERGSHWRNERMGLPGILELHDFPVVDHLHFALLWLLGQFIPDVVVVYNVYYLLGYPLAHLAAMAVFRHFKLSFPAAFAGGLLFAFLPYHYMRGESHYFLSAYWLVPVSTMAALWVCKGELPFFERDGGGKYRLAVWRWRSLAAVVIGLATASAGAYYAYFACALYAAAGLYAWAVLRTWKAPAAAAAALVGVVVVGGLANHFPTFVYQAKNGRNSAPHSRLSEEAEIYGLKIAHLVLPGNEHNSVVLSKLKARYNTDFRPLQNENERATLGMIGAAGLIGLLVVLLLPDRKAWPYGPLAALSAFILLLGTIGGFGAVFNHVVINQVRCYNRLSVYLAFLCFFAVLWKLDRWTLSRGGWATRLRIPLFVALIVVGVWDQTSYAWFRQPIIKVTNKEAERFRADRDFYRKVEAHLTTPRDGLPPGRAVFTLPFVVYPEADFTNKMKGYEHARGYIHTDTLAWSFGAIKGREADAWQREVSVLPARQMIERLVLRGFDGLILDTRGYLPKRGHERKVEIADALSAGPVLTHPGGPKDEDDDRDRVRPGWPNPPEQVFFDLRPFRKWLVDNYGPAGYAAHERAERERVSFLWLHGFHGFEPTGSENRLRWCSKHGTLLVVNPSDRPRTFDLKMTFRVDAKGIFVIDLDGPLVQAHFGVDKKNPPREATSYRVVVPPGRHPVGFTCAPPDNFYSTDSRDLCFFLSDFVAEEVP